ncbi:MAG: PIN domain-containing protein [Solirubrobacteraceae bacterium]
MFAIEEEELLLPNPIALDTSFVVEALIATQPLHGVCSPFLTRIFESGVSVATSELLRVELAEAAFAIALKERWAGKWRRHRTDGRSRPRAGRLLNHTLIRYDRMLGSMTHISIPLGDITTAATTFMTDYGIASYDAAHAASAIAAGAQAIVTIDTGFALLPASLLTIYTDRSRLASCRSKRPR